MLPIIRSKKKWTAQMVLAMLILSIPCLALAAEFSALESRSINKLDLLVGKSLVLKSYEPTKRVSIANPDVADFVLISPTELYLTGKAVGTTNMTLWQGNGGYQVFDLTIGFDVSLLKQQIHDILPDENDLRISATNNAITLSGRVSNAANLSRVLTLAKSYAPPEGKVNNLIEVRGVQQVMLEVRVAEMQRSMAKRIGVNFNYLTQGGNFGVSQLGGLTELVNPDDANIAVPGFVDLGHDLISAPFGTLVSPAVSALFRFSSNDTTWTGFIDALKSDGLVKVLAEPTLIALSGNNAYFLAGGEFPIPVPQGDGDITIDYREFGVKLAFTPTVLADNKINIRVSPEVSELDFSTAIQFEGYVTPGLTTRKAETVIELADGQSFAIAGLLRETTRDAMSKFPLLGDIPILGSLFRSRSFQRNETELIIIATPHLVKPLDMTKQPLPTDFYKEPNDAEFYMLGMMEGHRQEKSNGIKGDLDGEFGHAMPEQP